MGTVWRRISGSTLGEGGADAAPDTEAGAESFSARRPTEVFDSWSWYASYLGVFLTWRRRIWSVMRTWWPASPPRDEIERRTAARAPCIWGGVAAAWRCGSGTSAIPVPSRTSTGPPLQKFLAALRRPRGMFPTPCRRLALRPSNGARLPALARPSAPPPACCTSLRRPRQCGLARRHPPLTGVPAPPHHPTRPPLALAVQMGRCRGVEDREENGSGGLLPN